MSVGVDYLAKKWDQAEEDLKGALVECGFVVPADEDAKAEYVEYDGDLYWININRRGEMWINMKEKPRPVFKSVKAQRVVVEEPAKPEKADKSESQGQKTEEGAPKAEDGAAKPEEKPRGENEKQNGRQQQPSGAPLPEGAALLDKIRPHMRRNRRGPGGSGSTTFLSRALRVSEADLRTAFTGLGLTLPASPNDKPVYAEIGNEVWWLNSDSRGGLWINGREKKQGEVVGDTANAEAGATSSAESGGPATAESTAPAAPLEAAAPEAVPAPEVAPSAPTGSAAVSVPPSEVSPVPAATAEPVAPAPGGAVGGGNVLASVRLLLKETKTGSIAGKVDRVAEEIGKSADDLIAVLVGAGMKVPEKAREKPVFVEHGGEILWLNKNAKGELWLNAKASKFADKAEDGENEEDAEESAEGEGASAGTAGEGEKKPARRGGRSRKKEE
jgi:hypothetical protein